MKLCKYSKAEEVSSSIIMEGKKSLVINYLNKLINS